MFRRVDIVAMRAADTRPGQFFGYILATAIDYTK
jgi:hypothetical protein